MPQTIIKIRTWRCTDCDYAQDFAPTEEKMKHHFNPNNARSTRERDIWKNIQGEQCPSCGCNASLIEVQDESRKSVVTIMGEEDIDSRIVHDGRIKLKSDADEEDRKDVEKRGEVIKERRPLNKDEVDSLKEKIANDIAYFNSLQ